MSCRVLFGGGNLLTIFTVISVAIGLGLGVGLRSSSEQKWEQRNAMYLKLPGVLFLRTLSGLILPLIFSSLVSAIGSVDLKLSKRIGTRAIAYYFATSLSAGIIGTVLVHFIGPGRTSDHHWVMECGGEGGSTIDTLLDLLRNIFPPNLIGATLQNTQTVLVDNASLPFEQREINIVMKEGTNMLGLIVFALVLGVTLTTMAEAGRPLLVVFNSMASAMLKITSKVIWVAPIAVCFLLAGQMVEQDNILAVFENLSMYIGVMVAGYLLHGFVILPLLYVLLTGTSPFQFIKNIADAIFTAFGTASSSATLPITLKCLEENCQMDPRITRFLIPIGATVNMDGAALGLPICVIYISQLCGHELGFGELLTITLTSVATSVGMAGIPGVASVVIMSILASMGIPTDMVAFVYPVGWLQDRISTVVNVLGDAYGAAIISHLSKADLAKVSLHPPSNAFNPVASMEEKTDVEKL